MSKSVIIGNIFDDSVEHQDQRETKKETKIDQLAKKRIQIHRLNNSNYKSVDHFKIRPTDNSKLSKTHRIKKQPSYFWGSGLCSPRNNDSFVTYSVINQSVQHPIKVSANPGDHSDLELETDEIKESPRTVSEFALRPMMEVPLISNID